MTDTAISQPAQRSQSARVIIVLLFLALVAMLLWHFRVFEGKRKIAIVTSGDGPYWDLVIAGAQHAARDYNVSLTVERCKSDVDVQTASIKRLLGQKYDGIAISPLAANTQTVLLGEVATTTTLLTFDSDVPVSRRLCFVGTDNYAAGRTLGEQVRQAMPDGGEVIVCLGNAEKDNTLRRRQGLIDELLERPFEPMHPADPFDAKLAGPKYTVVATLVDGSDQAKAVDLAAQALKDHPGVGCYVGLLSYSAPAVVDAIDRVKPAGAVQVIGFDATARTLDAIESGRIRATVLQDQFGCGYHAVRILADNAHRNIGGLPMFQYHTLGSEVVNKDNLDSTRRRVANPTPRGS